MSAATVIIIIGGGGRPRVNVQDERSQEGSIFAQAEDSTFAQAQALSQLAATSIYEALGVDRINGDEHAQV